MRAGARSVNSDIVEETFAAAGAYVMGGACSRAVRSRGVTSRRSRHRCSSSRIGPTTSSKRRWHVVHVRHRGHRARRGDGSRGGGVPRTWRSPAAARCCARSSGRAARRARAAHHAGPARQGQRLFAGDLGLGDGEGLELTPLRVVETPEVTHVRYAVTRRHELVLDDRGSGETAA